MSCPLGTGHIFPPLPFLGILVVILVGGMGLHSSTFRLNLSRACH